MVPELVLVDRVLALHDRLLTEKDIHAFLLDTAKFLGEKLYEELLSDGTKTLPTHHEKIMISKDETMEFEKINALTQKIYDLAKESNKIEVVRTLKEIVEQQSLRN